MVREVLVERYASELAALLEPALHAAELGERGERDVRRHADVQRSRERRERVLEVVLAELPPEHAAEPLAAALHVEARALADRLVRGRPIRFAARAERFDRRPNAARAKRVDVRVTAVRDDQAVARHRPHELVELPK